MWMGFLGGGKKKKHHTKKKSPCPPNGFEISFPNTKMTPWSGTALFQLELLCLA